MANVHWQRKDMLSVSPSADSLLCRLQTLGKQPVFAPGNEKEWQSLFADVDAFLAQPATPVGALLTDDDEGLGLLQRIAPQFVNWAPGYSERWADSVAAAIRSERTRPERMRAMYRRLAAASEPAGGERE